MFWVFFLPLTPELFSPEELSPEEFSEMFNFLEALSSKKVLKASFSTLFGVLVVLDNFLSGDFVESYLGEEKLT